MHNVHTVSYIFGILRYCRFCVPCDTIYHVDKIPPFHIDTGEKSNFLITVDGTCDDCFRSGCFFFHFKCNPCRLSTETEHCSDEMQSTENISIIMCNFCTYLASEVFLFRFLRSTERSQLKLKLNHPLKSFDYKTES